MKSKKIISAFLEDCRTPTSGLSSLNMLRKLIELRHNDHFELTLRHSTYQEKWVENYLASLNSNNWSIKILQTNRRLYYARRLFGLSRSLEIKSEADVFLRFDAGALRVGAKPLVTRVTDLSAIRTPSESSLPWYGRRVCALELYAACKNSTWLVAISEYTKTDLVSLFPEVEDRTIVIRNGINESWYNTLLLESTDVTKKPYWIWYGYISPRKNLGRLIRAYADLRMTENGTRQVPDLLFVAEPAIERERLAVLIRSLGQEKSVNIIGSRELDTLINLVSRSNGLLFPSLFEGFGNPIIEAMAVGAPVLTSSVTAMREIGGSHAVFCNPKCERSIADGLRSLMEKEMTSAKSSEKRRTWAKKFTVSAAANRYSTLIDRTLG